MTANEKIAESLRARLAELTDSVAVLESARQAPLDADFAEQANELEGQDALAGIEDTHRTEINGIHAALSRLEAGTYGQCSVCGIDIPPARLAAMPTATTCINHAA